VYNNRLRESLPEITNPGIAGGQFSSMASTLRNPTHSIIQVQKMTTSDNTALIMQEINLTFGFTPNLFAAYKKHPALLEANWCKVKAVLLSGKVKRKTKEMIALLVSVDNNCSYCVAAHIAALKNMKVEKAQIDALLIGLFPAGCTPIDIALIKFSRKVNQYWRDMQESDLTTLRQLGISDAEILEVIGVVELFAGFNRFARTMQVQADF